LMTGTATLGPIGLRRFLGLAVVAGLVLATIGAPLAQAADITVEMPRKAVTGQLFTIRPVFPEGTSIAPDSVCRIELRWGDEDALFNLNSNNTFGGILFEGPASKGFCDEWTFTLPWVPFRQYDYTFTHTGGHYVNRTFKASVGSTNPSIATSNLPLVYVLPTTKDVVVGKPLTFTLFRLGGAGAGTAGHWRGYLVGSGARTGTEVQFVQNGGSKFTFTPTRPGYWQGDWAASPGYPWVLSGYYDPPAKRPPATPRPAPTPTPLPTPTPSPTEPPPTPTLAPSPTPTAAPATASLGPVAALPVGSPIPSAHVSAADASASPTAETGDSPGMLLGLVVLVPMLGVLLVVGLATGRLRWRRASVRIRENRG
jgi:hypothetical protein